MDRRSPGPLAAFLRARSRQTLVVTAYLCVIVLGIVDYLTPRDLSFLIFYLVPLAIVTVYVGSWAGAVISLACTAVWFMANYEELFPASATIIPYWNFAEKLGFFLLMTYIFAALRTALEHEGTSAETDRPTGLPNHRRFLAALSSEIARSRAFGHPYSLARLDIDRFRENAGRDGDAVLQSVADALRRSTRETDLAARIGDDEFAILMPESGSDAAMAVLRNLRGELSRGAGGRPITVSVGLATYAAPVHAAEEAVGAAGRLMDAVKGAGGNDIHHKTFGDLPAGP